MASSSLFPDLPEMTQAPASPPPPTRPDEARVLRPVRNQLLLLPMDLDATLPLEHPARSIWSFIERLDLAAFYGQIQATLDRPGRSPTDPKVPLALWAYATVDGIGSARHLARLCKDPDPDRDYRWLCGGVPINHPMLSDFRVAHEQELDGLLSKMVATLLHAEMVSLKKVAQDGFRVRASAGQSSFRRKKSLEQCLQEAEEQVERLSQEREHPDPTVGRREEQARKRAAAERQKRGEEALRQLPAVEAVKERQRKNGGKKRAAKLREARVSTTDPDARVMLKVRLGGKMPNGGFQPAYNVQFATDTKGQVIVGVAVTNQGTDQGPALPMEKQVEQRTGKVPGAYIMDGGFVHLQDIQTLEERKVLVYAPPKTTKEPVRGAVGESPEVAAWRERMQQDEGKTVYKERAATAECVNAQVRERYGLRRFLVRGKVKVRCVALLVAIAHNLWRWIRLSQEPHPLAPQAAV